MSDKITTEEEDDDEETEEESSDEDDEEVQKSETSELGDIIKPSKIVSFDLMY